MSPKMAASVSPIPPSPLSAVLGAGGHISAAERTHVTAKSTKSTKSAPTKSAKAHKSTKPRLPNPSHVPTPWPRLRQMWEAGESYEAMAKVTDVHYDANKPDPTKPTRAKIWKARNVGVKIDGKLVRFGARGKAKEGQKKGKVTKSLKKTVGKTQEIRKKAGPPASVQIKTDLSSIPEPTGDASA
jgi:hypothetical protein